MLPWMLYSLLTSALCVAAAALAEPLLRGLHRPARALWVVAIIAGLLLPGLAALRHDEVARRPASVHDVPSTTGSSTNGAHAVATEDAEPAAGAASGSAATMTADTGSGTALEIAIVALWASATLGILGVLLISAWRISRMRDSWDEELLAGVPVLVSHDVGPAVIGLAHHRIVVPRWLLALDHSAQHLVLLHEREHVRAGDPLLLWSATLLVSLMPWNVPLWLALRGMRSAIEMDCDARVLRASADPRAYCSLLLDVGERTLAGVAPIAALAEPATVLERRIDAMTMRKAVNSRLVAGAVAAAALVMIACRAPQPELAPHLRFEMFTSTAVPTVSASSTPTAAAVPATPPVSVIAPASSLQSSGDTLADARFYARAGRLQQIADSVIRTSYPQLTHRTGSTPAFLALVLDTHDRPLRHAASVDPALPDELSSIMTTLGVDTLSARTLEVGMMVRAQWNLTVGYAVEGSGPVHGTTDLRAWRAQSTFPRPLDDSTANAWRAAVDDKTATALQRAADSLAHARSPQAFEPHAGAIAVGVLFDRKGQVLRYASAEVPEWWVPTSSTPMNGSSRSIDSADGIRTLLGDSTLMFTKSGVSGRVLPKSLVLWGVLKQQ